MTRRFAVLFFLCVTFELISLKSGATAANQDSLPNRSLLPDLRDYEVISVDTGFHVASRSGSPRPVSGALRFSAFDRDFAIKLQRNDQLFSPDYYSEIQEWNDGTLISSNRRAGVPPELQCFYQGHVANSRSRSVVAVSTCDSAIDGFMFADGEWFGIAPASTHLSPALLQQHLRVLQNRQHTLSSPTFSSSITTTSLHLVYRYKDLTKEQTFSCGVHSGHSTSATSVTMFGDQALDDLLHSRMLPTARNTSARVTQQGLHPQAAITKWVELLIVNDRKFYLQNNGQHEQRSLAIANAVDAIYKAEDLQPGVSIVLTGMLTWTLQDPYLMLVGPSGICPSTCGAGEVSVDDLITKFYTWQEGRSPHHDNAYLVSGYDFEQSVRGYASLRGMCRADRSGGIVQVDPDDLLMFAAGILAHELGHNFGMGHDGLDNTCQQNGYLMTPALDAGNPPVHFSSCSLTEARDFMAAFPTNCLDNQPATRIGEGTAVCGNGVREGSEQCDCGDTNCAGIDPCCNGATCQLLAGAQCSSADPCCTSSCSVVSAAAQFVCRPSKGVCDLLETCNGVSAQCPADLVVGSGSTCADDTYGAGVCYAGTCMSMQRNCRTAGGPEYSMCPAQANDCGFLRCVGPDEPRCLTSTLKVQDGVSCGTGKQCFEQQCVDAAVLNPTYEWRVSSWSDCLNCEQSRNLTCIHKATGTVVLSTLCSPTTAATTQRCTTGADGCVLAAVDDSSGGISYETKLALIIVFSVVGVVLLATLAYCCSPKGQDRHKEVADKYGKAAVKEQRYKSAQEARAAHLQENAHAKAELPADVVRRKVLKPDDRPYRPEREERFQGDFDQIYGHPEPQMSPAHGEEYGDGRPNLTVQVDDYAYPGLDPSMNMTPNPAAYHAFASPLPPSMPLPPLPHLAPVSYPPAPRLLASAAPPPMPPMPPMSLFMPPHMQPGARVSTPLSVQDLSPHPQLGHITDPRFQAEGRPPVHFSPSFDPDHPPSDPNVVRIHGAAPAQPSEGPLSPISARARRMRIAQPHGQPQPQDDRAGDPQLPAQVIHPSPRHQASGHPPVNVPPSMAPAYTPRPGQGSGLPPRHPAPLAVSSSLSSLPSLPSIHSLPSQHSFAGQHQQPLAPYGQQPSLAPPGYSPYGAHHAPGYDPRMYQPHADPAVRLPSVQMYQTNPHQHPSQQMSPSFPPPQMQGPGGYGVPVEGLPNPQYFPQASPHYQPRW